MHKELYTRLVHFLEIFELTAVCFPHFVLSLLVSGNVNFIEKFLGLTVVPSTFMILGGQNANFDDIFSL